MVKEGEKQVFEAARTALQEQLRPSTPLQQIAFERVVCCSWRVRLATRMEARRLGFQSDLQDQQDGSGGSTDEKVESPQWYGFSRADLQTANKILLELRRDIESSGSLHFEEWKNLLVKTFGADFYDSLSEWSPVSVDAIGFADMLVGHSKTFNIPLPEPAADSKTGPIADPPSRWDMMLKIVDVQFQHVSDIRRLFDVRKGIEGLQDSVAVDFSARYYAAASRDLERAVAWYQEIRERGL
jgi:hypothetical protein